MFFKKISRATFLVATAFTLFSSCKKSGSSTSTNGVTADFGFSGTSIHAGVPLSFTNSSSGATTYQWDFGDNTNSTTNSPTHTFTHTGSFTVKLTATGSGGSNTTSKTIVVTPPSRVNITACKVISIPFTNPSGGSWDASNGLPDVYYGLVNSATTAVYETSTINNVGPSNLPISWAVTPSYTVTNLNETFTHYIMDNDSPNGVEIISSYSFSFNDVAASIGYLNGVTITTNNGTQFGLSLQWQ